MKLFVPGRICLFGEHSDWAGSYRRINGDIEPGVTLLVGTNQGVHADVKPHSNQLIMRSTLNDGTHVGPYAVDMQPAALQAEAAKGGFFSYAAGVAAQVLTHYRVRGLEIDNFLTDLPLKKGLSSSAAVCVMVARAFNRVYDLKMTIRGEMEYAYLGEIATPSRCGRMDQGCAYGNRPVMMTFDGDRLAVDELTVPNDLHFVVVDLCAGKDTREILNRLNHCYPFADDDIQRGVQEFLGPISARITREAADAMRAGDAVRVGQLMCEAQSLFDRYLQPACPSQLTAPVLHRVLGYPGLQAHVLGGKGVGSQGDGTAQFIVADAQAQDRAIEVIENELHMPCLRLVIRSGHRVRKAVIPAAGFGTRLFPASKAVKKELFPIVDRDGRVKPVIQVIVEEALAAGIEEVAIVVQSEDREKFEAYFGMPPSVEHFNKLSSANQQHSHDLLELGRRVTLLTQDVQEGFGHAVWCARDWVGDEPFLLMLGDHLYATDQQRNCALQVMDAYDRHGRGVVGLKPVVEHEVQQYGCVAGHWTEPEQLMEITEFAEKPTPEYARQHLRIDGLAPDTYLSVFGIYVLMPTVFDHLDEHIRHNLRDRGEFQLTSCLDIMRRQNGFNGVMVHGRRYDIGTPQEYRRTMHEFGALPYHGKDAM